MKTQKQAKQLRIYLLAATFILGWWAFAFAPRPSLAPLAQTATPFKKLVEEELQLLSPFQREEIQAALLGDFPLMAKLIADWQIDADLIEAQGGYQTKRLSPSDFLESQSLGRLFTNAPAALIKEATERCRAPAVWDDCGLSIDLTRPPSRFLPQTYVSATFLLSLAKPEQIIALPQGLRDQKHMFPEAVTKKIALDLNRYNAEKLYRAHPEIAFVAHYSHPATLEAFRSQGVKLFTLQQLNTVSELLQGLSRIGHAINRPLEARLLHLFMEAAMAAIDNRLALLTPKQSYLRVAYLQHYSQLNLPTERTLIRTLLNRMEESHLLFLRPKKGSSANWSIPIEQEQIKCFSPHCIIIASPHGEEIETHLSQIAPLSFVDETIQNSPSQYVVLAYYDLFQALKKAI